MPRLGPRRPVELGRVDEGRQARQPCVRNRRAQPVLVTPRQAQVQRRMLNGGARDVLGFRPDAVIAARGIGCLAGHVGLRELARQRESDQVGGLVIGVIAEDQVRGGGLPQRGEALSFGRGGVLKARPARCVVRVRRIGPDGRHDIHRVARAFQAGDEHPRHLAIARGNRMVG